MPIMFYYKGDNIFSDLFFILYPRAEKVCHYDY